MTLKLDTPTAFHATWEALQQYLDNQIDGFDEVGTPEYDAVAVARVAAVQKLVDQLDAVMAKEAA